MALPVSTRDDNLAPARKKRSLSWLAAMFDALGNERYRRLWAAGCCVNAARWMDYLVLGWVVLQMTGSPLLVGVAALCRNAPVMVLSMFAGFLADRFDRGRILVCTQVANLVLSLFILALFVSGHASFWPYVLLEMCFGAVWAVDYPCRRAVVYMVVGPGRLTNAVSLDSFSLQGSKMLGSILGGLLLASLGPIGCYALEACLYAGSLSQVSALTRGVRLRSEGTSAPVLASLVTGVREASREPLIVAVLIITILINSLVFPYQQIMPVFARDVLFIGAESLGFLAAADGLGSMVGTLIVGTRRNFTRHWPLFVVGSGLTSLCIVGFGLSPWYFLSVLCLFLSGIMAAGFVTMQSTITMLAAPERARGRVLGILSTCIGTQPLGAFWYGFATDHFGASLATAASAGLAALGVIATAIAIRSPRRLVG